MDPTDRTGFGYDYTYRFDKDRPFWRYLIIGALCPYVTLKVIGKLQMRTIPRWQYNVFCLFGGYMGARHAFQRAKVPIDPNDPLGPFGERLRYEMWKMYPNHPEFKEFNERYGEKQLDRSQPKPSLDNIIDNDQRNYDYNDNDRRRYEEEYDFVRRPNNKQSYEDKIRESKRDNEAYYDYGGSKRDEFEDPTDDISEFFESTDKNRNRRRR